MNRRTQIIIAVVVVVVVLIIGILLWWWLHRSQPNAFAPTNQNTNAAAQVLPTASAPALQPTAAQKQLAPVETVIKSVAMSFAERFGSYSSENHFSNIDELRSEMTTRMVAWTANYRITEAAVLASYKTFYGISTKALSATIDSFDASSGQAVVTVTTQREESKGTTINPRVFYQKIQLTMVNTGDGWRVDSATWQ